MTTYIFDLDETICHAITENHQNYYMSNLTPDNQMIKIINSLFDSGHEIIIMTGRGSITGLDWIAETEKQLETWGVKYTELRFVKKPADYMYIDDKACSPKEFKKKMRNVV